jgi:hypothetical protein
VLEERRITLIKANNIVQGPFTYEALPPSEISFIPLKQSRAFNAAELLQVRRACMHD